ncbi:D-alanine--poly(phosphoribitol) ligase subunit DltC [Bacillus toyonensis]|uniref:D-alanine--poly(phosphoribitol) ligase subunit DltC n=1 Tax=Bacillus toyonensis TaxID=155322 RepID=UPI000BF0DEB7|nr:D-alanine--poly(phosphoribitol) ligase subunit 2 [Bacillus toyonensis]
MTEFKNQVLDILEEVCENDIVKENSDVQLFEEGILDSFGTVSLLVEFQVSLLNKVTVFIKKTRCFVPLDLFI